MGPRGSTDRTARTLGLFKGWADPLAFFRGQAPARHFNPCTVLYATEPEVYAEDELEEIAPKQTE